MKPFRIKAIERHLPPFPHILEIGCGFHAPSVTKKYIGDCAYYGVEKPGYRPDRTPNDRRDLACIDKHILTDLADIPDLDALGVRNGMFDAVIAANTLEHFERDVALYYHATLPLKLKLGGVYFVEVPSHRVFPVTFLPSHYDGIEHRAFLDMGDLVNLLLPTCEILEAGIRRDWRNILRAPVTLPLKRLMGMPYPTEYTDILGLSYYIVGRRNK